MQSRPNKRKKKDLSPVSRSTWLMGVLGTLGALAATLVISIAITGGPGLLGVVLMIAGIGWAGFGFLTIIATPSMSDYSLTLDVGRRLPVIGPIIRLILFGLGGARNPPAMLAVIVGGFMAVAGLGMVGAKGGGPMSLFAPDTKVVVVVSGLTGDDSKARCMQELVNAAGEPNKPGVGGTYNLHDDGPTRFTLDPVMDVDRFAKRIGVGRVTGVSGRTIQVTVGGG